MIFGCVPIKLYFLKKIGWIELSGHSFLTYLFSSWFQLCIIAFFWRLVPPHRVLIFGNIKDSGHTCGCFLFRTFAGVWSPHSIPAVGRECQGTSSVWGAVLYWSWVHIDSEVWLCDLRCWLLHSLLLAFEKTVFFTLNTFTWKRKTLVT